MTGRARLAIDATRPLHHAIEVRHKSFLDKAFVALLRKHRIGLVVADTAGKWPKMFDVTAELVYVRLHGDVKIYTSGYGSRALDEWAQRIRSWDNDGRDVYVYFDNDVKSRAPFDALSLMKKLGLEWKVDPPVGFRVHAAGVRIPKLRKEYGPRVTGRSPAWQRLGRR